MPAQDPEAGVRGVMDVPMVEPPARMKIDVLSIGSFPGGDECRTREPVRCHSPLQPARTGRTERRAQGAHPRHRDRGQSRRRPRADRCAAEARSDFGLRRRDRLRRSRRRARAQHPGDQYPGHSDRRSGRPRHRPDAGLGAPDRVCRSLCARRHLGQQGADPARAQRRRQDHGRARPRRHRPRDCRSRRRLPHARDL